MCHCLGLVGLDVIVLDLLGSLVHLVKQVTGLKKTSSEMLYALVLTQKVEKSKEKRKGCQGKKK